MTVLAGGMATRVAGALATRALLGLVCLLSPIAAGADATVLLCEPYGFYGKVFPQGHIAVYLDRVCAESPTVLRPCQPGEIGIVISRYPGIGGADWVAMPLIPYLYAVDRAADVPTKADRAQVEVLRNTYREMHLRTLVPDAQGGQPPEGNWYQLAGAAYDRRILAFTIVTTPELDEELIRTLNGRPNVSRWNWVLRNCADFVQDLINFYHPGAMKTGTVSDLGLTTPKHIVKSLVKFCGHRPDLQLRAFAISQVPGSRPESKSTRGVLESLVLKPMYVVPLAVVQPWIPVAFATGYIATGRFNPKQHSTGAYDPAVVQDWARGMASASAAAAAAQSPPVVSR
jgi:hypothetical protein